MYTHTIKKTGRKVTKIDVAAPAGYAVCLVPYTHKETIHSKDGKKGFHTQIINRSNLKKIKTGYTGNDE